MNQYTIAEQHAAIALRKVAASLVEAYEPDPAEQDAAILALLLQALENEQGWLNSGAKIFYRHEE